MPIEFVHMSRNIPPITEVWEEIACSETIEIRRMIDAAITKRLNPKCAQSTSDGEEWSDRASAPDSDRKHKRDAEDEGSDLAPPATRRRITRGSPQLDLGPDITSRDSPSTRPNNKIAILPVVLLGKNDFDENVTGWVATTNRTYWTAPAELIPDGQDDAVSAAYAVEPCRSAQERSWHGWMPTWGGPGLPDTSQFTSNDWAVFIETTNLTGGPNRK